MQKEEEAMERSQGNRPLPVQPKSGPCIEKKSDNGQQRIPKSGRKREQNYSKNDANTGRKQVSQRNRGLDKRPKPRGYSNYKERDEVAESNRAEVGSALQQGSKKANLNHLLNFTFAPRESKPGHWKARSRTGSRVAYNKELFLQANCQFVVRDTGDYSLHATSPDKLVDWDLLEQVRLFGHGVPSCPICLYPPTAAKITRCGHIYCWVCILHYLSLDDDPSRKCPICYESIMKKDLKSVVSLDTPQFTVGQEITMRLMKKERGSVMVLPKNQWRQAERKPLSIDADVDTRFSKLLLVSIDQVQERIIKQEKLALLQQKEETGDSLDGSFVDLALDNLAEREEALLMAAQAHDEADHLFNVVRQTDQPSPQVKLPVGMAPIQADVVYSSAFSDEELDLSEGEDQRPRCRQDSVVSIESVEVSLTGATGGESSSSPSPDDELSEDLQLPAEPEVSKPTSYYYFFQAEDGQHLYMHSINARCLLREYGSLEYCPDTITARIEALEEISMTRELRERLRYLSHLPLTCEFKVAELRLKPPLVSRGTLDHFHAEFDKRRYQRQRKARDERKMSKRIEKEEQKMNPYHNSRIVYSEQIETVIVPSAAPDTRSTESSDVGSPPSIDTLSESPTSHGSNDDPGAPVSFAQMLRAGKAKPDAWPKLAPTPEVTQDMKPAPRVRHGSDSQSEGEDHVPVPTYRSSFSDAIKAALDTVEKSPREVTEVVTEESPVLQTGKKKKTKKKLLFTTTMNRAK